MKALFVITRFYSTHGLRKESKESKDYQQASWRKLLATVDYVTGEIVWQEEEQYYGILPEESNSSLSDWKHCHDFGQ